MFTSARQLRLGRRRAEPEFGPRSAPRTVDHTTIVDRPRPFEMSVEIKTSQNYAIGESNRSNEYRLPAGVAILVILVLSILSWGVILVPLFAIFHR
jgi:hypothetical protein